MNFFGLTKFINKISGHYVIVKIPQYKKISLKRAGFIESADVNSFSFRIQKPANLGNYKMTIDYDNIFYQNIQIEFFELVNNIPNKFNSARLSSLQYKMSIKYIKDGLSQYLNYPITVWTSHNRKKSGTLIGIYPNHFVIETCEGLRYSYTYQEVFAKLIVLQCYCDVNKIMLKQ